MAQAGKFAGAGRNVARDTTERYWRLDDRWAEDRDLPIQWTDDWQKTYALNVDHWKKDLQGRKDGQQHLQVRIIALREAMVQHFPKLPERHVEAWHDIANNLRSLGYWGAANGYYIKAVEASPGRTPTAIDTLWAMLHGYEYSTEGAEYAARRILALKDLGQIDEGENIILDLWKIMAIARRRTGRFQEAADALEAWHHLTGPIDLWRSEEASLYLAAGHLDEGLARLRALSAEEDDRELRQRIGSLAERQLPPSRFAGDESLTLKWSVLQRRAPAEALAEIVSLIEEDPAGQNVVPAEEGRYASLWSALDRHASKLAPDALAAVRQSEQTRSAAIPATEIPDPVPGDVSPYAPDRATISRLLVTYRCFPHSAAGGAALLEAGQRLLRHGQESLAIRCFQDVLSHSADAELCRRAQAGLAMAQCSLPAQILPSPAATQLREVKCSAFATWPAALLRQIPPEIACRLSWTGPSMQINGDRVLLAGFNNLACLDAGSLRLLWIQSPPLSEAGAAPPNSPFSLPGSIKPQICDGRVYARWGCDSSGRHATGIAAFELDTGRFIWSSEGAAELAGFLPMGDPTVAEGRVYYLAQSDRSVALVCLDAASGVTISVTRLAEAPLPLAVGAGSEQKEPARVDFSRHGSSVTVDRGAVFCCTDAGVIARFDARDGAIEWAAGYPRAMVDHDSMQIFSRRGGSPLVIGDAVIFIPRDRYGVFALDRQTGRLLWDRPFYESQEAAGVAGEMLVLKEGPRIHAIDAATGAIRWQRCFAEEIVSAQVVAGQVLVNTGAQLRRIDAASGATLEQRSWATQDTVRAFCPGASAIYLITDRWTNTPSTPRAPPAKELKLPLREIWSIDAPAARMLALPAQGADPGRILAAWSDQLACLDPSGAVRWRRTVRPGLRDFRATAESLVLLYYNCIDCLEPSSGALRWHCDMPFAVERSAIAGNYLVVGQRVVYRQPRTAGIDLETGAILWRRSGEAAGEGNRLGELFEIVAEGPSVHIVGRDFNEGDLAQLVCRPADGAILSGRPLGGIGKKGLRIAMDALEGVCISESGTLTWFTLAQQKESPVIARTETASLYRGEVREIALCGRWCALRTWTERRGEWTWIYSRDNPAYRLSRRAPACCGGTASITPWTAR